MKYYNKNEKYELFFSTFEISEEEILKREGTIPDLHSIYFIGENIFSLKDLKDFKELCYNDIKEIFKNLDYRLYLFANVGIANQNPQIARYKKVWKSLQSTWDLDGFKTGPEIEEEISGELIFSSIAEIRLENLSIALEIFYRYPQRYAIFASRSDDYLSDKKIKDIFKIAFDNNSKYNDEINYLSLAIHLCKEGGIVFNCYKSSDNVEINFVYNTKISTHFNSYFID